MKNKYGFGLIETFISIFIISFIFSILFNNYFLLKRQINKSKNKLNTLEQTSLVEDLIKRSVRSAGFTPCVNIEKLVNYDNRFNQGLKSISFINGQEAYIKMNRMSENFSKAKIIAKNMLFLSDNIKLDKKYPIIIADCVHAEVQNVSNIFYTHEGAVVTLQKQLKFNYQDPAYIGVWLEEKYFMHKTHNNYYSLFFTSFKDVDELSNEITKMSIEKLSINLLHFILGYKSFELEFDVALRCF